VSAQPNLDLQPPTRTLRFDPMPHQYWLEPDGIELPSVTTALKSAGLIDYSMIPQDVLQNASARGTAVHMALQFLDEETLDLEALDFDLVGYVIAYQQFCQDTGFVPAMIEQRVWSPQWRYAGTLDRTGTMGADLACLDFKTGLVMPAHALQLAAYTMCLPDPRRFRRIALKLNGDGTYRVHEFPGKELRQDFDVFLAALACHNWRAVKGVD